MAHILVTGGTGTLGRVVVNDLRARGREVRVLSRRPSTGGSMAPDWAVGDLRTGEGIGVAVAGVDIVIHCASHRGDVGAARNLIDAARQAGGPHVVYISIVGVDQVPLGYYRSKLEVERLLENSDLPWTILRTTQFHDLILRGCQALARLPAMVVPARTDFQPIEVSEVAAQLVELSGEPPAGRVPDMGGPEVRGARDLARNYLDACGRHRMVLPVRLPGPAFAGYRKGGHLAPERAVGQVTFAQFLAKRIGSDKGRHRETSTKSVRH